MAGSGGSGMKKSCDCCRRYLDHLDEKKRNMNCFLRRMTTKFRHSMIVPNRFLKNFSGKFSGTIKLESPNGNLYCVEVTERSNQVVLRHGWEAFVDANHIEENDSLLFRHVEECYFEVLVFDSDGCEKVFSCAGIKSNSASQERSIDSDDIISSSSQHDTTESSSSSQHDTTESSDSGRFARCQKVRSCHRGKTTKMASTSLSSESGEDIPSENESFESDDLQTSPGAGYVLSRNSYLSEAQEKKVLAVIQEIQPESTVFVAVMRKCHVQPPAPYLAVSKEYASAHFPHEGTKVTLQRPDKSKKWHPKFYKRKDKLCMLRGQWLNFVHDNHVQEGDICLLLPTKGTKRFIFTAYLIRATATLSKGGTRFQRVGSCHGRSSKKMASTVRISEESTEGENVSSESDMHGTSHEPQEIDSGGPSEPPYILPNKSHLSQSQKKIVEDRVRAIQPEFPIFVAIMGKGSVGITKPAMIELGVRFAAPHLPDRIQTAVLQCMTKAWKTKMVVRCKKRWFLTGGWSKFVADNGLRVGDICLFELKKDEKKPTMKVHIISREQF
ncbi:hypothetical protein ACP70R_025011 [Stipagrostis hirtigluma subsp. patula]